MMNDSPRNDAYFAALQNAVTPDTHVLEIGTGSGLLAMMAARLGARQVTTCEVVAEIAETARAIVADNGLAPPVTVIGKKSTKLEIGTDMEERADLLVSEILSSEFLGEGVLGSIEDAKRRLLKPGPASSRPAAPFSSPCSADRTSRRMSGWTRCTAST
jgi:type III protein arginine methyltransferase